jgi:hypothetical protein
VHEANLPKNALRSGVVGKRDLGEICLSLGSLQEGFEPNPCELEKKKKTEARAAWAEKLCTRALQYCHIHLGSPVRNHLLHMTLVAVQYIIHDDGQELSHLMESMRHRG